MSEKPTELHLTYGVPEPIDIHVGTERSSIHLSPMADELGRHVIKVFDNTGADRNQYVGSVCLEPDRTVEAVQAETERLLRRACAVVGDVLRNNGVAPSLAATAASAVRDAIDAEPPSEYERGRRYQYERDYEAIRSLRHTTVASAVESALVVLANVEPPDAK